MSEAAVTAPQTAARQIAPDCVYVVYIAASQAAVWNALTDHELTRAYWLHDNVSDWKKGSPWKHVRVDAGGRVDLVGEVIEIDPPRKMVISWAAPDDAENGRAPSRVTFEVAAVGPDARLTVTHSELEAGSGMHAGVTRGWPAVLSNLKTLLETGKVLSGPIFSKEG